jgi:hypothetical protein
MQQPADDSAGVAAVLRTPMGMAFPVAGQYF